VSWTMLERARADVWRELEHAGLASPRLARVRVTRPWIRLDARVGTYTPGGDGTITVPAVSLGRVAEYRRTAAWTGVRDILRHEYAHALADHHPELVARGDFAAAFGAPHDRGTSAAPYAFHAHVSEYAATEPSEDFAETVMVYLKCGGAIERYAGRPVLHAKLAFVARLSRWLRAATAQGRLPRREEARNARHPRGATPRP
jgi:hypothetical protein